MEDFAHAMIEKYHCPVRPNEPPRDVLAALAFLVRLCSLQALSSVLTYRDSGPWLQSLKPPQTTHSSTASRRVRIDRPVPGGEEWPTTCHGCSLENVCTSFHSPVTASYRLLSWEDNVIAQDQAKYNGNAHGAGLAQATSRDALAESSSTQHDPSPLTATASECTATTPTFSLYGASALPVNIPTHAMDGNVELHVLGDLASAIENHL